MTFRWLSFRFTYFKQNFSKITFLMWNIIPVINVFSKVTGTCHISRCFTMQTCFLFSVLHQEDLNMKMAQYRCKDLQLSNLSSLLAIGICRSLIIDQPKLVSQNRRFESVLAFCIIVFWGFTSWRCFIETLSIRTEIIIVIVVIIKIS